ncbi:MAG: MarR family transcriptional regulator [Sphingomonas sp.]|uniref:MarR family winged helix-turn-helix transcriptional regulator n=1 Tax=Sphingomonas sp. TaxID=28214 RepID=UPI001B25DBAC|nr:MarR family transcriptional regulator [Sphingomonas sp.]MBO9624560.1 MarR family transcriptional regulator [Sphingomonas sp.]
MEPATPPVAGEAVIDALVPVAFAIMAALNRIGAENDLSLTMLRVMGILRDRRPRMAELADHLGLEKQTLSGLIARGEKRGLVARTPNADDGRATDVLLTREGYALIGRLYGQFREALAPLIGELDAADQRTLEDLLTRMQASRRSSSPL